MNRRMVLNMVGQIVRLEAALLALPALVSLLYGESRPMWAFLATAAIALVLGTAATVIVRPRNRTIYAREGFVIVALAWIAVSALGALPFVISGDIPHYTDAFFETVSGFTTTGSSILTDVEALSRGALFWRSFTHWIGGMGVLVLVMAIVPSDTGRNMHILRAEMPGPIVGKLTPRVRDTAKVLYLLYLAMSAVMVVFLLAGGMDLYDSLVHMFGAAGTGGFSSYAASIGEQSAYIQWVIGIFMLLFGVNFNIYYLMLMRRFTTAIKSRELWTYLGIVGVATVLVTVSIWNQYESAGEVIRHAFFQVSSVITTTGYATADFNVWSGFAKVVLLLLMFVGACAGSTGGGLKVSRVMLLFKSVRRDLTQHLHPRAVGVVKLEGKRVDDATVSSVGVYLALYFILLFGAFLVLSLESFGVETNFSAVVACLNNIGPGLGAVGPAGNFAAYSDLSKLTLSAAMLFGRLEIYPLLFALTPSVWMRHK